MKTYALNTTQNYITASAAVAIPQTITAEAFNRYIKYVDAKPKTIETYTRALKQFYNYLMAADVTQPRREDVINFRETLKAKGLKATTIQNYLAAVKLFFKWTAYEGIYPNVAERVKGLSIDEGHKKDYLTPAQAKNVIAELSTDNIKGLRDYAIITLMITAGLRTIEIVRANIEDLGTAGGNAVLYVQGKGRDDKNEYVILAAEAEAAIRAYLKARGDNNPTAPLFTSTSNNNAGQRMTTHSISVMCKSTMRAAGYDSSRLTAHSLRHTAITIALLEGATTEEAQGQARHRDVNTTAIYNHAIDKTKNRCSDLVANAIFRK